MGKTQNQNSDMTSVRVAVRVRPLNEKENIEKSLSCVAVDPETNQIIVGKNKSFRYDYAFDINEPQSQIYDTAVKKIIDNLFEGYNATIFAYGQTGSGKTYTMGTAFSSATEYPEDIGIIPRVVEDIFAKIDEQKSETEFLVRCAYLEIYNEQIRDLLSPKTDPKTIKLREEDSNIQIIGIKEEIATNKDELLHYLEKGGFYRTTGATLMNQWSSRSHSIFTIVLEQRRLRETGATSENGESTGEEAEYITAKFHLVDLAGSERVKKTGAVGLRFKESIQINSGLLSLGNVISALGDEKKRKSIKHVPYRDSKLTRLLQDSLGGNSNTLMIACISPADSSFEETLNTLKYANRARNIKNKPVINRDPHAVQLSSLREEIRILKLQLLQKTDGQLSGEQEEELKKLATKLAIAGNQEGPLSEIAALSQEQKNAIKKAEELEVELGEAQDSMNDLKNNVVLLKTDLQKYKKRIENVVSNLEEAHSKITDFLRANKNFIEEKSVIIFNWTTNLLEDMIKREKLESKKMIEKQKARKQIETIKNMSRVKSTPAERPKTAPPQSIINPDGSNTRSLAGNFGYNDDNFASEPEEGADNEDFNTDDYKDEEALADLPLPTLIQTNKSITLEDMTSQKGNNRFSTPIQQISSNTTHELKVADLNLSGNAATDAQMEADLSNSLDDDPLKASEVEEQLRRLEKEKEYILLEKEKIESEKHTIESQAKDQDRAFIKNQKKMEKHLKELTIMIHLKEELIRDLVKSEHESEVIKQQYEEKIFSMESEYKQIQNELGSVMKELEHADMDKAKKEEEKQRIRSEYEKKLQSREKELEEFRKKQNDSEKLIKLKYKSDRKVSELEAEILNMRKRQEYLKKKIKEETMKQSEKNKIKSIQISHLKKEAELNQKKIRELEVENQKTKEMLEKQRLSAEKKQKKLDIMDKQKAWLDGEVESYLKKKEAMERLEKELQRREEIIMEKERIVQEKNIIQKKRLRESFVIQESICGFDKEIIRLDKQIETRSKELSVMPNEEIPKKEQIQIEIEQLMESKSKLEEKREKYKKKEQNEMEKDERHMREIDERAEDLDAEIEYKNETIKQAQMEIGVNTFDDSFISSINDPNEAKEMVKKYFEKVIELKEGEQNNLNRIKELEMYIKQRDIIIRSLKNNLDLSEKENERKIAVLKQELMIRSFNNPKTKGHFETLLKFKDKQIALLNKDNGYYKTTNKELTQKLREMKGKTEKDYQKTEKLSEENERLQSEIHSLKMYLLNAKPSSSDNMK